MTGENGEFHAKGWTAASIGKIDGMGPPAYHRGGYGSPLHPGSG